MKKSFVFLALLALAGCKSTADKVENWQEIDAGPKPTNYEALTVEAVKGILKDPDSAKITNISGPYKEYRVSRFLWAVCGSVNAKNSYGGYTGSKPFMVSIYEGVVLNAHIVSDGYSGSSCSPAALSDKTRR